MSKPSDLIEQGWLAPRKLGTGRHYRPVQEAAGLTLITSPCFDQRRIVK